MNEFNFDQAVTQAFRTSGGKQFGWRLVFWTAAAMTIVTLVVLPMILPYYGDLLAINQQNMQALKGGNPANINQAAMNAVMLKMAPAYLLLMTGYWATWVACEAALHRKVLKNQESPRQPLRLGRDELRVFGAQLGVFGLLLAFYVFGIMIITLVGGIFGMLVPILGGILVFFGIIAYVCILFLMSVRFAPAAALSIANDEMSVLRAKDVTKGKFWTLFPAYLVVFVGGYILIYIVMITGVNLVTGDADFFVTMSGLGEGDPKDVMAAAAERLKNPLVMLMGILSIVAYCAAYALWMVSLIGVSSYAAKVLDKS